MHVARVDGARMTAGIAALYAARRHGLRMNRRQPADDPLDTRFRARYAAPGWLMAQSRFFIFAKRRPRRRLDTTHERSKPSCFRTNFSITLRKERVPVSVFLVNGIRLAGHIQSFDQYSIRLHGTPPQLVLKRVVATVVPEKGGRAEARRRAQRAPAAAARVSESAGVDIAAHSATLRQSTFKQRGTTWPRGAETEAKMDAASLYREEIITDRKVGTIRMMTPLNDRRHDRRRACRALHGRSADHDRRGSAADQLRDRSDDSRRSRRRFGDAAKEAIERTVRDLQELRRQAGLVDRRSRQGGMGGLGPVGWAAGGGGKIQMP